MSVVAPAPPGVDADRSDSLRYAVRLAAAVLLAFAASAVLRLPEGSWAVMSALIVVRPSTGSTLGAGWDRVRGVLVGAALGVAAVEARRFGIEGSAATLVLVTALAFAGGLRPALRSAPISALIVVTSGAGAGPSAGHVAWLRTLEIGLGVAAALLVSLADLRAHARPRFRRALADLLRALAGELEAPPPASEAAEGTRRAALRRLAVLAEAADRERRLFAGWRGDDDPEQHRRSARLAARTAGDAALFRRLRRDGADPPGADARRTVERLRDVAAGLDEGTVAPRQAGVARRAHDPARDRRAVPDADTGAAPAPTPTAIEALAGALVADDMRRLARSEGLGASPGKGASPDA